MTHFGAHLVINPPCMILGKFEKNMNALPEFSDLELSRKILHLMNCLCDTKPSPTRTQQDVF